MTNGRGLRACGWGTGGAWVSMVVGGLVGFLVGQFLNRRYVRCTVSARCLTGNGLVRRGLGWSSTLVVGSRIAFRGRRCTVVFCFGDMFVSRIAVPSRHSLLGKVQVVDWRLGSPKIAGCCK